MAPVVESRRPVPRAHIDNADVAGAGAALPAAYPGAQIRDAAVVTQMCQGGIEVQRLHASAGNAKGVDSKTLPQVCQALHHSG